MCERRGRRRGVSVREVAFPCYQSGSLQNLRERVLFLLDVAVLFYLLSVGVEIHWRAKNEELKILSGV